MPSVTQKQHNFFKRVVDDPEFAKKVKVKKSVAKEFLEADELIGIWQDDEPKDLPPPVTSESYLNW